MLPAPTDEIDRGKRRSRAPRPRDPHIRLYLKVLFGHEIRLRAPFVRAAEVEEGEGGKLGKGWRVFVLRRHGVSP